MTNYEWVVKEYPELVKHILSGYDKNIPDCFGIAVNLNGTPCLCKNMACPDCKFYQIRNTIKKDIKDSDSCAVIITKWLEEEHIDLVDIENADQLKKVFGDYILDLGHEPGYNDFMKFFDTIRIKK